jgi:hypothetical protein
MRKRIPDPKALAVILLLLLLVALPHSVSAREWIGNPFAEKFRSYSVMTFPSFCGEEWRSLVT